MIVTIILPAGEIPNETVVRKPTGAVEFVLKTKGVPLYSYLNDQETEVLCKGLLILQCGESLTVVSATRKLAVDFEDYVDAAEFLLMVNRDY